MYRRIAGTASLLGVLVMFSLAAPVESHAQGALQNETDLAFIRRMTSRLQRVEQRAEQLEDIIRDVATRSSYGDLGGRDQYGRETRGSAQDRQNEYRSAERQMRSTGKRARKEREELVELQRAGSTLSQKQREKIERGVSGMERKIANAERDIQQQRF